MAHLLTLLSSHQSLIMGVLNVTPDSFFDGGQFESVELALAKALTMQADGAHIIDVGGESTRPGAQTVSVDEEIKRVVPIISSIRKQSDICISIDTSKPEVMQAAVEVGANFVNDVNGLRAESAVEMCARLNVPVCIMHMQGEPQTMQNNPVYIDVLDEVNAFFESRIKACCEAGIRREHIVLDPGFGFGKTLEHNMQLLKRLNEMQSFDLPVLAGLSRKSMLGQILKDTNPDNRLHASVVAAVLARLKGARIFRVHDVKPTVDGLKICNALSAA